MSEWEQSSRTPYDWTRLEFQNLNTKTWPEAYARISNYGDAIIVLLGYSFPVNHWPSSLHDWSPDARLNGTNWLFMQLPSHFHIFALHHIATSTYIKHSITIIRCSSLSLQYLLVNSFHSTWSSTELIARRISVVCFDGSGTGIPVLLHVCSALWAVDNGGVGACCHTLMFVTNKPTGFGGPYEGQFVWVCASQNSAFGGVNPWTNPERPFITLIHSCQSWSEAILCLPRGEFSVLSSGYNTIIYLWLRSFSQETIQKN